VTVTKLSHGDRIFAWQQCFAWRQCSHGDRVSHADTGLHSNRVFRKETKFLHANSALHADSALHANKVFHIATKFLLSNKFAWQKSFFARRQGFTWQQSFCTETECLHGNRVLAAKVCTATEFFTAITRWCSGCLCACLIGWLLVFLETNHTTQLPLNLLATSMADTSFARDFHTLSGITVDQITTVATCTVEHAHV